MKPSTFFPLIVLTLTLAACGGGGSDTAPVSAMTASASQQAGASSDAASPAASASTSSANSATVTASTATPTGAIATTTTAATQTPGATPAATPSTSASPSPAPAPSAPQIIEYYGDSTVWGLRAEVGGQVAKPAPVAFAETLPDPSAYIVRNEGVSGSTACELLNGTDGRHQPWSSQMAASKAGYVFVNYAINDEWKHDVGTYKSCLRSLAQTARQHGKQMIFETPNPTRDSGSWGLDVYVNAMKEVASQENVPVVDQYKYLTDYLNGKSPYTICPDGLHPTEAVYIMKGQYAAGVFTSLFIK